MTTKLDLLLQDYHFLPYEKKFAIREVQSLLKPEKIIQRGRTVSAYAPQFPDTAERLTYFAKILQEEGPRWTQQHKLESVNNSRRQATRYSVHGIHEYKGKFNPQTVRALLNIFDVSRGQLVIDPFSGSGTTLAECAHLDLLAIGFDLNPLACHIANAKALALSIPTEKLKSSAKNLFAVVSERASSTPTILDDRLDYLGKWFSQEVLTELERLKETIELVTEDAAPIFTILLSDLLRDYSHQDPNDLRIRRRKSPLPTISVTTAFRDKCTQFLDNLEHSQKLIGTEGVRVKALNQDSRLEETWNLLDDGSVDFGITSPPYATALPYIDTQRLSLVWMGLCTPRQIRSLESEIIGSREFSGAQKLALTRAFASNSEQLPAEVYQTCWQLQTAVGETDGFRRQNVPLLLYRYLCDMRAVFQNAIVKFRSGGRLAMIVGPNRTTLGGKEIVIDTPSLLATIAGYVGWQVDELTRLQSYQRYGLHQLNSISSEALLVLRK